jgi:hypothetical protein
MPELLAVEKQNAESVRYSYPDIGDESAVEYFPYLAAKMLIAAAIPCAGEPVCTKQELQRQQRFDSQGQLQAEKKFVLKTVRNGKYTQLE